MFDAADFPHTATYWAPGTPNGYGGFSYTRSEISVRWEERVEQFTDPVGEIRVSKAVVFVQTDIELDGYLYLGSTNEADPSTLQDAFVVKQFRKIPDLRAVQEERRAYL